MKILFLHLLFPLLVACVAPGEEPYSKAHDSPALQQEREDSHSVVRVKDPGSFGFDASNDVTLRISARPVEGFNYPYYLFVPASADRNRGVHILVQSNNTGIDSDDFAVHDEGAEHLVNGSDATLMARKLKVPLLVPVFPRPSDQWHVYTHLLDEDTLRVQSGPMKRIDLQLIRMIESARDLLRRSGLSVEEKIFMHGFSASGNFANRFSILHPRIVRAVAAGGVNAIPTIPASRWQDQVLPYPVGIADFQDITGIDFDEAAYRQVSQYIYMGYMDRNDMTLYRDAFSVEYADLVRTVIGRDMTERWETSTSIYRALGIPAQMVMYHGTAHTIRPEMLDDAVRFFEANSGKDHATIEPHQYPFVPFDEIQEAHINGLYWLGDERIPEWAREGNKESSGFVIRIEEWIEGQERLLQNLVSRAGFDFTLRAEGHEDIVITERAFAGTHSSCDGEYQAFGVRLTPEQLGQLARGIDYALIPSTRIEPSRWIVNEGVALRRPLH